MKRFATLITVLATSAALSGCLFGKKDEATTPAEVPPPAEAPMATPTDTTAPAADGTTAPNATGTPTSAAPTEQAPTGH